MTDALKVINDIEELYVAPILKNGDYFVCPVCKKQAKKIATIENHMKGMDCHNIVDILLNTVHEEKAHMFFKEMNDLNSLFHFRRHILYKRYLQYTLWCSLKQVDPSMFFFFLQKNLTGNDAYLLRYGVCDKYLKTYRIYLLRNNNLIDSTAYINNHKHDMINDPLFLTRSLETAKVGIEACIADSEINEAISSLPFDYYERLDTLFVEVMA